MSFTNIEYLEDDCLLLNPLIILKSEITKPNCTDAVFKVENNLSELKTVTQKSEARKNLGISDPFITEITWENSNLNDYVEAGIYNIKGTRTSKDNVPIINEGTISALLTVLVSENNDNKVITLLLNLNNNVGGEGNVYIRSKQGYNWKPWGKLQTNVEVGQITPDDMSNLIDNGIYSGVCVDGPTVETFVLIVINNYLAASQAGFGGYISQLKYAIDLNRGNTVKTRTCDAYGIWSEWSEIGGSTYKLPKATLTTLGGVKLGTVNDNTHAPLVNIGTPGSGVGISIDSSIFKHVYGSLTIKHHESLSRVNEGLSVKLGTESRDYSIIPCCIGSVASLGSSPWCSYSVGIPYNPNQFYLHNNGLNLKDDIGSGVIKVTWDGNSNMDDYIAAGVYDITGRRESLYDSLPIANIGENATIAARLIVTVTPEGATTYRHSIGQTLILSNAEGKETKVYIRNGNRTSTDGGVSYTISWSNWRCLQGMVEYGVVTDEYSWGITDSPTGNAPGLGMHGFIENGMYSGIYTDDYTLASPTFVETFVLVVINDYVVSSQAGTPRRISQLKYATDTLTGQCTVKKRVGTGGDSISWGDWEDIGGGSSEVDSSEVDITYAVNTYGLPTLISQGLAKEGVTYKCSGNFLDPTILEKLDVNRKIYGKMASVNGGIDQSFEVYIKLIPNLVVVEVYMTKEYYNAHAYLHYYKFIMDNSCSYVKVSTDMTDL